MTEIAQKSKIPLLGSLLVGGTVVLTAVAFGYFYKYKGHKNSVLAENLTEEKILNILLEFKRDIYPLLKKYSIASKQLQMQFSQQFGNQIDQIEEFLVENLIHKNPEFEASIQQIELKVLARNNVSDADEFKKACEHFAKTNKKIDMIMKEMKITFRRAVLGVVMPITLQRPESLTSEVIIEIFVAHVKALLRKIFEINLEFREKSNSTNFKSREYALMLQRVDTDNNFSGIYAHFPDSVRIEYNDQQLFSTYLQQLQQKDRLLVSRIEELEDYNSKLMVKLHTAVLDQEKMTEEIENFGNNISETQNAIFIDINLSPEQLKELNEGDRIDEENKNWLTGEKPHVIETELIEHEMKIAEGKNVTEHKELEIDEVTGEEKQELVHEIKEDNKETPVVENQKQGESGAQQEKHAEDHENADEWEETDD